MRVTITVSTEQIRRVNLPLRSGGHMVDSDAPTEGPTSRDNVPDTGQFAISLSTVTCLLGLKFVKTGGQRRCGSQVIWLDIRLSILKLK
jgi:hypothetical protein